ncbi:MAG: proton-conducting transporter membrane subunit [Bacteroidota bacterium]
MNIFFLIILIFFSGAILSFIINKIAPKFSGITTFITIAVVVFLFFTQIEINSITQFSLGGIQMQFGVNNYTYIFAILVLGLSLLASLYSIKYMQNNDRLGYFYSNFILTVTGMLGIIFSRDFISFFIFWEIMTWSSYLIVLYNGKHSSKSGMKYMIFSAIGAYAMLTAIVSIKGSYGTFIISDAIQQGAFNFSENIYIPIMLLIGFAVKAALMPLHVWAPNAYSKSPMSFTSIFSGAMSKMGILGMGLVLASVYSQTTNDNTFSVLVLKQVLGWLGGITAVMATIYALIQTDAKKLLAYSSVAQLGYIIVGLSTGTKLGVMAALFLAVIHAVFKGALFMVAGAVEKQVGTTDMTKISGLIRKMPFTFFTALVSIIALAGIPPLGGFVGKWMLYEALITESNNYFLVIVIFFSSTAAFLYSYRFLFGLFLGQEEKETEHVKEAPVTMIIPMVILALILIVTGAYPGILFEPIAHGMHYLGFSDVNWDMSVLVNVWGEESNMAYINLSIGVVFVVVFLFLTIKGYKGTKNVGTKDISTSGEIPTENENLTFQLDFFKPFERAAAPLYKRSMDKIWNDLGNALEAIFDFTRRIYTGNGQTYALFVIIFLVILLIFKNTLFTN